MDVHIVSAATSQATIDKVRASIVIHEICFIEMAFVLRVQSLNCLAWLMESLIPKQPSICHTASNKMAERGVQTFKEGIKKTKKER